MKMHSKPWKPEAVGPLGGVRVLDLARDRLAAGGALADVLPMDERRAIAQGYKQTAGFDPAVLNERVSFLPAG